MTGADEFLRAYVSRDRWLYLWWGLAATALYYSQAVSVKGLYATQAELARAAVDMENNTAFVAMLGPARALDTVGGQVMWQSAAFGAILAGLMSMFLVGRHTRAEEESGRDELLRASAVSRHASLTAALTNALFANVLLGLLVSLSLISFPLDAGDSWGVGIGLTCTGWVFTGTALLAAQLTSSTRSMYGVAGTVIAAAYSLRAVGDVGTPALSWLSPIGWYQAMDPFSGLRWWPILLLLATAAVATAAAYALFARRDFGGGVRVARPGPDRASRGLSGPLGFAWRLQRGSILGWCVGMLFLGLAYGSIGDDVGTLIGDSQASQDVFAQGGAGLVDGFYAVAIATLALVATGFTVSSALTPHTEEDQGRVEALLATGLSRRGWLLAQVATTVAGSVLVLVCSGGGLALGFALVTGDTGRFAPFLFGTLGYVAPALVVAGLARLLYGVAPRWSFLAWLGLVVGVVVVFFGPLLRLPAWVQGVSPYHHLALVPAEPFRWAPFAVLLVLAGLLSAAGQLAFARRDLE
ncbi:MAG: polyketide antibiotic transporter [Nocardioides sp.]